MTTHDLAAMPSLSVAQRTEAPGGLVHLTIEVRGLSELARIGGRQPAAPLRWFESWPTLYAFSAASACLAPIRRRYRAAFLLTNDEMEFEGERYGTAKGFHGVESLVESLPRVPLNVALDKLGGFGRSAPAPSMLFSLEDSDLAAFIPLLVGDVPMPATYAFLFLSNRWSLESIKRVAEGSATRSELEGSLLSEGGAMYYWFEEPYFELVLRRLDLGQLRLERLFTPSL